MGEIPEQRGLYVTVSTVARWKAPLELFATRKLMPVSGESLMLLATTENGSASDSSDASADSSQSDAASSDQNVAGADQALPETVDGQSDDASAQSDSTDNANDAGSKTAGADDSKKSASSWSLPDFSTGPCGSGKNAGICGVSRRFAFVRILWLYSQVAC